MVGQSPCFLIKHDFRMLELDTANVRTEVRKLDRSSKDDPEPNDEEWLVLFL